MWIILFLLINGNHFEANIDSFSWLIGTWEIKSTSGNSRLEVWSKYDDHSLIGKGLGVSGVDTTQLESIKLIFQNGEYWYVPTVPDQNNAMPVKFKLVSQESTKYIFENPKHDYPQRIVYDFQPLSHPSAMICQKGDTLLVKVEKIDGTDAISFLFIRK